MSYKKILSFLVFIFSVTLVMANDPDIVGRIEIQGNKVTKNFIIEREIQHPVGVPFDSVIAIEDRNRIDNLGIFSDVRFYLTPASDGTQTLIYQVVETWRIFPLPVITYEEEKGWSFGGVVMIKNFRGRNEFLQVFAAGGGSEFGGIQFQDPWIAGDHISLQSHIFLNRYDYPFLPFEYRELDGEVTVGRYFGYQWKVWATVSLERRWINYFNENIDLVHNYIQTKFQLIFDTRDLYIDPSQGVMVFNEIRPEVGLDKSSPHNMQWECMGSVYKTVIPGTKKWVAGGSFFFHKYFGKEIPYNIASVGGVESIRGWKVVDFESYNDNLFRIGLNRYFASVELRQTLIPKFITPIGTEFGLILAEFADMGGADDSFWEMFKKKPIFGVGVGIRFFIPGNMLFRFDYGIGFYDGQWREKNLHIGIGHKF